MEIGRDASTAGIMRDRARAGAAYGSENARLGRPVHCARTTALVASPTTA